MEGPVIRRGGGNRQAQRERAKGRGDGPSRKGEGSTDQRSDGRWRAYVTMADGKRKYLYANTRREIVRKLTKAQRDLERMGTLPDERLTVEDFLKSWLDRITPGQRQPEAEDPSAGDPPHDAFGREGFTVLELHGPQAPPR